MRPTWQLCANIIFIQVDDCFEKLHYVWMWIHNVTSEIELLRLANMSWSSSAKKSPD